jgi:phosphoglycerate dehydrogenase-like enzyme
MRVLYYAVRLAPETETAYGNDLCSMDDLLREADIVSLHIPLLPETRD